MYESNATDDSETPLLASLTTLTTSWMHQEYDESGPNVSPDTHSQRCPLTDGARCRSGHPAWSNMTYQRCRRFGRGVQSRQLTPQARAQLWGKGEKWFQKRSKTMET